MMTKVQDFIARANQFAARAAAAKSRVQRNTFLSLEQSCRTLAENEELAVHKHREAIKAVEVI